uniref:Uncharacterized protein n=1 Tax=Strigamia maritima TaxID=126957 RepID=T1J8A1_STRMM
MSTLTLNSCIILFLFLFKTTSSEETECLLIDKTVSALCKSLDNIFKQDNGKLSQNLCSCGTAMIKADSSYCHENEYAFPDIPNCAELAKSKSFKEAINSSRPINQLSNYVTNVLFKNIFDICNEKSEEMIIKSVESIYKEGNIANGLEVLMQSAFPSDLANLFTTCYRDLRKLANLHPEN